nr:hypothetical protein BaRGS_014875 [Batillaria attramentaria]
MRILVSLISSFQLDNLWRSTQCSICDSALMHTVLPGFRCEIKEHISKDNILEALRDVFRTVNALMNDTLLKHQRGGSVLLGIAEEKCNPSKAWELVENLDLSAVLQTELKIWKDKEPEDDRRVFYLAAGKNVPDSEEKPTGQT